MVSLNLSTELHQAIRQAAEVIIRGGVVAFPTDTVYGIGAYISSASAVERIYTIKGRAEGKPLQLLLADIEDIETVALEVPPEAWVLAQAFLPGGLTLVLKKSPSVPDQVTAGLDTVAVRVPDHPVCLELIRAVGAPLVATSANLSGRPSALDAHEVREQLGQQVDFILDGGRAPLGRDSTIVDLTQHPPKLLREGAVPTELLLKVCPNLS
ncbi:MAG: threonylcarbamoyl-AMP synthase [Dehalococcoidia bacterium]|nr:threonylcarbamoyl-AMP synthase [Dehalococcoidia bacterium]